MNELIKWIMLLHVGSTLLMVGLIWFVQVVHYPLFARVGPDTFTDYEAAHQRLTTKVVLPLMVTEMVTAFLLLGWRPESVALHLVGFGAALVLLIWIVTFTVQVPQHARLSIQFDQVVQQQLVAGNWVRTVAWSARGMVVLWMLGQSL